MNTTPTSEKPKTKIWSRTDTLALASQRCTICFGLGLRPGRNGSSAPCNCVFRRIFRDVFQRFRDVSQKEKYLSRVKLETNGPQTRRSLWSLKNEEFIADVCLVSRRFLTAAEYRLFKFHYLLGADWKLCCPKLGLDRGAFFHEVYRVEQKLGRVFAELQPYSLWPLDEYFGGSIRRPKPHPLFAVESDGMDRALKSESSRSKLRFPLKASANAAQAA